MGRIVRNGIPYGGNNAQVMTYDEYKALGDSTKNDGIPYYISDLNSGGGEGGGGGNENGVVLTQAEWDALGDEKYTDNVNYYISDGEAGTADAVMLTQAEWDALGEDKYSNGVVYVITDGGIGGEAKEIQFDDSEIQLGANNVQGAIENLNSSLNNISIMLEDMDYDKNLLCASSPYQSNLALLNGKKLSDYRFVMVVLTDNVTNVAVYASTFVPLFLFMRMQSGVLADFYEGSRHYAQAKYVDDTHIDIGTNGGSYSAQLFGFK